MFDQMTVTKTVAAFCGALLILMLSNWAASALFSVGGGHGEEHAAYVSDTGAEEAGAAAASDEPPFEEVFATADAAAGEKVFAKCRACHKIDGANATGPHLDGVVGRAVGAVEGFGYSDAMKTHGGDWTPEKLSEFLANPKADVPGTKMSFVGLPRIKERVDLIAYLESLPH